MGADDSPDEKSVGSFGPATRALLFMSIIGQATNPGFQATGGGEQTTPWQLTNTGLGGMRGNTQTTPDLVMRQVLAKHKKVGVVQLVEIVRAALAAEIPTNTIDPDYVDVDSKGQPVPGTERTVTERFLRSAEMGWGPGGRGTGSETPAVDPFDLALSQLGDAVSAAAANTAPFSEPGEVARRFLEAGLPENYTKTLLKQARKVVKMLEQGEFIAQTRRGVTVVNFADDDDEGEEL
jgi:hypothetical protein